MENGNRELESCLFRTIKSIGHKQRESCVLNARNMCVRALPVRRTLTEAASATCGFTQIPMLSMGRRPSLSVAVLADGCFSTGVLFQHGSAFVSESLTEELAHIVLNQIKIMECSVQRREPILSGKKQRNVAETWVGNAWRFEHNIITPGASSLKLLFFFLEVRYVLLRCPTHLRFGMVGRAEAASRLRRRDIRAAPLLAPLHHRGPRRL